MRNKLIYCIPLALSITCLIGCAAKAAQMPAEPEPVALLPEQKQSSTVTNDAKNETISTPQQSEHEDTPVRIVESNPADTPANADTEVPQAASAPMTVCAGCCSVGWWWRAAARPVRMHYMPCCQGFM